MEAEDFFVELMFGSGATLGVLIIIAISIIVLAKFKYSGILIFPISLFMGIQYFMLTSPLPYHGLVMFILSIFAILQVASQEVGK